MEPLDSLIRTRLDRRSLLGGGAMIAAFAAAPSLAQSPRPAVPSFKEIAHGIDETHHVAEGHEAQVLLRWGDPIFPDSPPFDPMRQTAASQARQFGYNNDYIGFIPLPRRPDGTERGLLCVNHEYPIPHMMFPNVPTPTRAGYAATDVTPDHLAAALAALGASIVEIARRDGRWDVIRDSRYNRRITGDTPGVLMSGPAAGHPRLRTSADPTGTRVRGTFGNCAGGTTPWGTYLTGEENVDYFFDGRLPRGHREAENHAAMGATRDERLWSRLDKRFDLGREPNELNRFGWVVEIDPLDPTAPPKKRTALGRCKHEGAETIIAPDGRLVVYSGDDEVFQHLYKFVTRDKVDLEDRAANRDLLDHGTLYVARFEADGTLRWLPLVHGQGPLTAANGFASQADVLIEARRAAKLLGATPMDRPEDVQPHPTNGRVYVMLTNNGARTADQIDAANPREANNAGHIIEIATPGGDHAADHARWEPVVLCGLPTAGGWDTGATWNPATSENGWFSCPDNCAIDPAGNVWIATDQGAKWKASGTADGLWWLGTEGEMRGVGRMFFRAPVGAEMTGPRFTPDGTTLFASIQHPGADGTMDYAPFARPSSFDDPATRWPDFKPDMPPRPSVVVITRTGGGPIGT